MVFWNYPGVTHHQAWDGIHSDTYNLGTDLRILLQDRLIHNDNLLKTDFLSFHAGLLCFKQIKIKSKFTNKFVSSK